MAAAPLSWLLKIGADELDTEDQSICGAINELFDAIVKNHRDVTLEIAKLKADSYYKNKTLNLVYPVGAVYFSTVDASPAVIFPNTTWEPLSRAYVRIGSEFKTGGSSNTGGTVLTVAQLPSHTHTFTGSQTTTDNKTLKHTHTVGSSTITTNEANPAKTQYYIKTATGTAYDKTNVLAYAATSESFQFHLNAHSHSFTIPEKTTSEVTEIHNHSVTAAGSNSNTGSGEAHSHTIEPPYVQLFAWRRTA